MYNIILQETVQYASSFQDERHSLWYESLDRKGRNGFSTERPGQKQQFDNKILDIQARQEMENQVTWCDLGGGILWQSSF